MGERFGIAVADGITLAAERWTTGGPPVALLHAGVCDRRSWNDVGPAITPADVVAYDRRGFGETPGTDTPFRHVDDLLTLVDAVFGEVPVTLVGNSMGGALAIDFALEHPARVAGLVLIAPAISGEPEPDGELDPATRRWSDRIDAAEDDGDHDALNAAEVSLWLDGPAGPEGRVTGPARTLLAEMNSIALGSGLPEDAGESGIDAHARLDELRAPTTLTWGDLDVPFIVARCERLARTVPAITRTHVFTGAAHLPGLERPDEVARVVLGAIAASSS